MTLWLAIPHHYWNYPHDIWLRVLVSFPAIVSTVIFAFLNFKETAVKLKKRRRNDSDL
jgi:hypothetical protein